MSLVERAQEIRARLMNPPNAVDDQPIDLRRKKPIRIAIPLKMGPITPYRLPRLCPMAEDVTRIICEHYRVSPADIESTARTRDLVKPRQVWAYFAQTVCHISYPSIGRHLGGRDHSTAYHSREKVESRIQTDKEFAAEIEILRHQLERLFTIRSSIVCIDPREF